MGKPRKQIQKNYRNRCVEVEELTAFKAKAIDHMNELYAAIDLRDAEIQKFRMSALEQKSPRRTDKVQREIKKIFRAAARFDRNSSVQKQQTRLLSEQQSDVMRWVHLHLRLLRAKYLDAGLGIGVQYATELLFDLQQVFPELQPPQPTDRAMDDDDQRWLPTMLAFIPRP